MPERVDVILTVEELKDANTKAQLEEKAIAIGASNAGTKGEIAASIIAREQELSEQIVDVSPLEFHHFSIGNESKTFATLIDSSAVWSINEKLMFYESADNAVLKGTQNDSKDSFGARKRLDHFITRSNHCEELFEGTWRDGSSMNRTPHMITDDRESNIEKFKNLFFKHYSLPIFTMFSQLSFISTFLSASSKSKIDKTDGYFSGTDSPGPGKSIMLNGSGMKYSHDEYLSKIKKRKGRDGISAQESTMLDGVIEPFKKIDSSIKKAEERFLIANKIEFYNSISGDNWDDSRETLNWANTGTKTKDALDYFYVNTKKKRDKKAFIYGLVIGYFHILEYAEKKMEDAGNDEFFPGINNKIEWRNKALEEYIKIINDSFDCATKVKFESTMNRWIGADSVKFRRASTKQEISQKDASVDLESILGMSGGATWDGKWWRKWAWFISEIRCNSESEYINESLKTFNNKSRLMVSKETIRKRIKAAYDLDDKLSKKKTGEIILKYYDELDNFLSKLPLRKADYKKVNKTTFKAKMKKYVEDNLSDHSDGVTY